jgi:hypothetical protein
MTRKLAFCAAALSSVCLLPLAAVAQTAPATPAAAPDAQAEISIGMQSVSGRNTGLYGRYNGFTTNGADLLFGFDYHRRDAWDSGNTSYFDLTGSNVDFQTAGHTAPGFSDPAFNSVTNDNLGPEAEVSMSVGEQGKWGITAGYNAITYTGNIIDSLWTVTNGVGTLNDGMLPYGGASNSPMKKGSVTSWTSTALSPNMQPYQTGTRRDIVTVGGQYQMDEWTFKADVQHEHKEGSLEESLYETYGGMAFTMPVDYDTDRFDLSASYIDPDYQAVFEYTYSRFTDNNIGVSLPFPVSQASLSATSGPYAQSALYSTPPSNSAHYVTAMVSDKLTDTTRINFNGRVGVELQNSTFPANSADPNLSPTLGSPAYNWFGNLNSLNQGTSATSPDISAWVYQGNISVDSELAKNVDGRATYSFDGRDVHTDQYQVWNGGHAPDAAQTTAVYVVPQNWFKQTAKLEVGYMVDPASGTKLTVSYAFNNTNRTDAQVEHSITNTVDVELSSMVGTDIMTRLTYEHASRNGTLIYGTAWGNLENGTPEIFDTPSGAYYQAPMDSDAVTARADYAPSSELSGGLFVKFTNEDYHYPAIPAGAPAADATLSGYGEGIKQDTNLTVGPDANWKPTDDLELHAFYTYERIFFDNFGNGACADSNTGTCAGSAGYFENRYDNAMNTGGVSAKWQASDKLKLGADYNVSTGTTTFGEFNGVQVPAASVAQSYQNVVSNPNIDSTMHDLRLTAIYALTDKIQGSLLYDLSMFKNNDWDDLTPAVQPTTNTGTAISILTPGYAAPKYNVSSVGLVVKVQL